MPAKVLIIGLKSRKLADEISEQVSYFNYKSNVANSLEEIISCAQKALAENKVAALILDSAYCALENLGAIKALAEKLPIIVISTIDNIHTRLLAVKAGGEAFFLYPLELSSLLEKLDKLTTPPHESSPYRILIVEDSKTQANVIRSHLEHAGMLTDIVMDPLKVREHINEFQPDLILLDLYMPECSGLELARLIRQEDPFVGIPIVFLSAEDDINKQLHAISGGGDDFLTKPISTNHLVGAVTARAIRARRLRSEMSQDSLTGLLNHTRILEQLELELARAKRNQTSLSFAMIDIDEFKTVNDSHGHPIGDKVIKALSRLLKQRLRKVDSIGRYGGEEFAVIFPQTDAQAVFSKIEQIRIAFSKLLHQGNEPGHEFYLSISIGLTELSADCKTLEALVHDADKALYQAKAQGRNCCVVIKNELT